MKKKRLSTEKTAAIYTWKGKKYVQFETELNFNGLNQSSNLKFIITQKVFDLGKWKDLAGNVNWRNLAFERGKIIL